MKAMVFTVYGSPDLLQLSDVPKPTPGDGEVLIKVHASSINAWDWEYLSGTTIVNRLLYGLFAPKPTKRILGADVAGTVETVGRSVTRFRSGDEVFGDLWDNWGGFAEYACAREDALELKPVNSTFEEAAAIPQAGVLALQGVRSKGELQAGQTVLINGAGGGVGTFAVQIAKLAGAEVTGVDYPHKVEVMFEAGADHVIDCTQEDFTRGGRRYDFILDVFTFRSILDYKRALSPTGTYTMVGGIVLRVLQALLMMLWGRLVGERKKIRLVAKGPNKGLAELKALVEAGKIVPIVDRIFQLGELPDAFHYFAEGRHKGKIVISTAN